MNERERLLSNRERLRELAERLENAPFDVGPLRHQLASVQQLPEAEARHVLRWTLAHLTRAEWALSSAEGELDPAEEAARQQAIDWIAEARSVLVDHTLN